MRLRQLQIERFRGIRSLTWTLDARLVCLVGPGDSTKTTILDAIGAVLSPRYNLSFSDADFYACDLTKPIVITAAVVDLPDRLIEERAHGKNRSGIRNDGTLEHDPLDDNDVEECLLVRLTVDQTLEPVWEVIRPEEETGDRITAGERAQLGFFRVGESADTHLRWGRTSALTGVTASKTEATHAVVEAQRQARLAVADLAETPLHEAAKIAQSKAVALGSAPFADLRPGLDPRTAAGSSALVLHEGQVPLTSYGLGSRRLTSLAVQDAAVAGRSIVAIDEVEQGLEPHRLLHLVRFLRSRTSKGEFQVFLTTQAALVVEAISAAELFVVRASGGETTVSCVPQDLASPEADTFQGLMRERPSSLLARRVVVGEGATETGFVRRLLAEWDAERDDIEAITAVTAGATVTNGSGDTQAPRRAAALAKLGYPTLLLMDNDTDVANGVARAKAAGAEIVQWREGCAIEDVVCQALPVEGLQELIELAADEVSEESVLAAVASRLDVKSLDALDVMSWIEAFDDQTVRDAVASAAAGRKASGEKATRKAWFKREDRGERLAGIVFFHRRAMGGSDLANGLMSVKKFAYADVPDSPAKGEDRSELA